MEAWLISGVAGFMRCFALPKKGEGKRRKIGESLSWCSWWLNYYLFSYKFWYHLAKLGYYLEALGAHCPSYKLKIKCWSLQGLLEVFKVNLNGKEAPTHHLHPYFFGRGFFHYTGQIESLLSASISSRGRHRWITTNISGHMVILPSIFNLKETSKCWLRVRVAY